MGRITKRASVTRVVVDDGETHTRRRADFLSVEEPLEIRISGEPISVTMRTPGHDVELAAGFLVGEGVLGTASDLRTAIHCGGPGAGPDVPGRLPAVGPALLGSLAAAENTYNVLDLGLGGDVAPPPRDIARNFYTTSSCGVCGAASLEAVEKKSRYDLRADRTMVDPAWVLGLPDVLRAEQKAFDKTGGLHAAGLFDAESGELLVLREDVGRHNAVDKVVGWALLADRLPLGGTVLQVSGRASFELVQKAVMAGIPMLSAVSAPSSLAVELAADAGLTLFGFVRGASMNVYSEPGRLRG